MQNLNGNLHPGMRDLLEFLLVLIADGQMGIVFSLAASKTQEIWLLKDVSGNKGGMCIGRTLGEDLSFQDRPGQGLNTSLSICNL